MAKEHASPRGARLSDSVDLIDEYDAGRLLLGLFEQVPHAGGTHPDEQFDELTARDREEGDSGFAGDGLGEQRLARARRTHQKKTLRNSPAQLLVLLWVFQEIDDLH